jgi:hypothetical protein
MELEWCQNLLFWSQFAETIMVSSLMALHDGVILTPWNLESTSRKTDSRCTVRH